MPGKLSTHALDTYHGRPAAGLKISLFEIDGAGQPVNERTWTTNADGRTDAPLLSGSEMRAGTFQLVFDVGAYFQRAGLQLPEPAFLGLVPVRFSIADAAAAYHVPLLFSPWAYSTYRGS